MDGGMDEKIAEMVARGQRKLPEAVQICEQVLRSKAPRLNSRVLRSSGRH
jgi:hypothetical protein